MTKRHRVEDAEIEDVVSSVHADSRRDLIADIRTGAADEYLRVKRHKQTELNYRCISESSTCDTQPSRAQKKKVDNHASAVASRCKQEFLVSEFEALLRRKLSEAQILTAACAQHKTTIADQLCELRAKDAELSRLRKELHACRRDTGAGVEVAQNAPQNVHQHAHLAQMPVPYARLHHTTHYSAAAHEPLSPTKSPKITDHQIARLKTEDVHVFPTNLQHADNEHVHLAMDDNTALQSHDVAAAMDEIISPAVHAFYTLPIGLIPAELDFPPKHVLHHLDTPAAARQRLLTEESLKANLQSDNTTAMLNPVA